MERTYAKLFRVALGIALVATVAIATVALSARLIAMSRSSSSYFVELPLYFHPALKDYFVRVQVEDKSGWMLLDTGSSMTLLDEAQFDYSSFGQTTVSAERVFLPFSNAYVVAKKVQTRRLVIGSWKAPSMTVGLVSGSAVGIPKSIQGYPVLGILGYDVISLWPFVRISKDYLVFTDQRPVVSRRTKKVFPLVAGAPVLCIREAKDDGGKKRVWVIDTGAESHYAEDPNLRVSSEHSSPSALFTAVQLRALGNQNLWIPAVATAQHSPPLVGKLPYRIVGIIGNGILSRYEIFINHRDRQVSFMEAFSPNQRGTFGLLLFSDPQQNRMLVYFTVPLGTLRRSDSLMELIAVNGKRISGTGSAEVDLLQSPQIGVSVDVTVRDQAKREYTVSCIAFAPDEIGANFFRGNLHVGTSKYAFTVLEQRQKKIWLYPFQWALEDGGKTVQVVPRALLCTPQSGIVLRTPNMKTSREARSESGKLLFEMQIRPLY